MNDLQAFKVIHNLPGGRRVIQISRATTDRYLMFYLSGMKLDVLRSSVTNLVRIVQDGKEIGDPRWN